MLLTLETPLIKVTNDNTFPADFDLLYSKYGKEFVDQTIEKLNYRKVDPLPKEESDEYPILYVFRHGQSTDNKNMVFSGWRDSDITQEGIKQAEILAPLLKDKKIDMLVTSDQVRSYKTMQFAISQNTHAKELKILKDKRIREKSYGLLQGHSKLELYMWNKNLAHAYRRTFDTIPPQGESVAMVCARVKEFCDEIVPLMKKNKLNVAVSCHGNSIRGFRMYFEDFTNDELAKLETPLGQDYAAYSIY